VRGVSTDETWNAKRVSLSGDSLAYTGGAARGGMECSPTRTEDRERDEDRALEAQGGVSRS
jgi:hypothetical protein